MQASPTRLPTNGLQSPHELARIHRRRKSSLGVAALGLGLIFLGSLIWQLALAGVVLVVAGLLGAAYWSFRLRKIKGTPWDYDPELDGPDPHKRHNLDDKFEKED